MSVYNNLDSMFGMYKEIHGELNDVVPEYGWLSKAVPYSKGERVGEVFEEPVLLSREQGQTYGGTTGDAYDLRAASAKTTQRAKIYPYSSIMRSALSFDAASRGASEKTAFKQIVQFTIGSAMEAVGYRREISMLHGQSAGGLGVVAIGAIVDVSSTQFDLIFTAKEWASGIWQGAEGAELQIYDAGGDLESFSSDSLFTVALVDDDDRRVRVTASADLISQVETKNDTEALTVFFYGSKTNDMEGIDKLFSNLTGTIHNISAATYGLWAGNYWDVGNVPMTKAEVKKRIARLCNRGLGKKDLTLLVNPLTWADLESEDDALVVHDSKYNPNKGESGFERLIYRSQNGTVEIVAHPCVKGGEAYLFSTKNLKTIGSADKAWPLPGPDTNPFQKVPNKAGSEILIHNDMSVYCRAPAQCGKFYNITNTGS